MRHISCNCNFEDINQLIFSFNFLRFRENVHDNKQLSYGNSNPWIAV